VQEPCGGHGGLGSASSLGLLAVAGGSYGWGGFLGCLHTGVCLPPANAVPRHVACGPALSPPGLLGCGSSPGESWHILTCLACVLGWQSLEIEGAPRSSELRVGACWARSLCGGTDGSAWGSAASPTALTHGKQAGCPGEMFSWPGNLELAVTWSWQRTNQAGRNCQELWEIRVEYVLLFFSFSGVCQELVVQQGNTWQGMMAAYPAALTGCFCQEPLDLLFVV